MKFFSFVLFLAVYCPNCYSQDYVVFSIDQSLPMGKKEEVIKKNFYVNVGENQGVVKGTKLDVFRNIFLADPYKNNKRYNYNVKIGELVVVHSQDGHAIASLSKFNNAPEHPLLEIDGVMVGDNVKIHLD